MLSIEARIIDVGRDLAATLSRVLEALPGGPHRPQWLANRLGLNAVLTSRLLKATQQHDPMIVTHLMPGPEPLRRLLAAAEKKKVNRALINDARNAVDRFQQLIDAEAGDRSSLDAIISGWLPEAREKVELIAKQSVFRGVSHLLGASCDVGHYTVILNPSERRNDRADQVWIMSMRGLRRVRPGANVVFDTVHSASPLLTVDSHSVDSVRGLLLEPFCSSPIPEMKVTRYGNMAQYTLVGDDVGVRSAVNLVHATYLPENKETQLQPGQSPHKSRMAIGTDPPMKVLLLDVIVHEEIFPGQQPTLEIYRTAGAIGGPANRHDVDRLNLQETVQSLGQGLAKFRSPDSPHHQEIIRFVCERRGWDVEKLRGFRCRIEYPMYSSEAVLSFDLPPCEE